MIMELKKNSLEDLDRGFVFNNFDAQWLRGAVPHFAFFFLSVKKIMMRMASLPVSDMYKIQPTSWYSLTLNSTPSSLATRRHASISTPG